MSSKLTAADREWETSLLEAVAAARTRYRPDDPHLIHPLEGLADWYAVRGKLLKAKPLLRDAIAIRIQSWGPKHPELAAALNLLAKIVLAEGKPEKAEEYLRQAVRCLRDASPPRPLELADTWCHWAELTFRKGDPHRAMKMCQKARAALSGNWTRYPGLTLRLRNNLGAIHLSLGRTRRALREFARNDRLARTLFPADSPALVTHHNNLAEALRRMGDHRRAEILLRRALKIARATWGWRNTLTASTAHHLAGLWSLAGRWTAATRLYDRVYRIRRKLLPAYHADVLRAAHNVVEMQSLQQAWLPAEKVLDPLYADLEATPSAASTVKTLLRTRLARLYLVTGRLATAERWLNEAWQELQSQSGEYPLLIAELAFSLGLLHSHRNAPQTANEFLRQALTLQEQTLGGKHLDLASTLIELGRTNLLLSETDSAVARFERAVSIRESALGPKHPLTAQAVLHLAEARGEQQDWSTARNLCHRALSILEQNPESISCLLAQVCGLMSRAADELDQHELAEQFAVRELALRQQQTGIDHVDLAPALLRLGRLQRMSERIAEAVGSLGRGLSVIEKTRGQYDPAVIPFLEELCSLRATDGPTSELGPLVERYVKCQQRIYGHQSLELGMAQDQAAEWWRAAGDENRAQELSARAASLREMSMHVFGELM